MKRFSKFRIIFFFVFLFTGIAVSAQEKAPGYMKDFQKTWDVNPKKAALEWFKDAHFGMFIHFSPASALANNNDFSKLDGEWFKNNSRCGNLDAYSYKEYLYDKLDHVNSDVQKVIYSFDPKNFSADSLADLAVSAGMKYITFTTQHVCGRLFMFDTSISPWNSQRLFERDFVKELSIACQQRGLGLFFYVMPPANLLQAELKIMLKELLTNYGPIAGIWFDGIWSCYMRPSDYLETSALYAYVNEIQPQCLISFKTGFTGDEDFLAAEWHQLKYTGGKLPMFQGKVPDADQKMPVLRFINGNNLKWVHQSFSEVWDKELVNKPVELSTTMIKGNRWFDEKEGVHKNRDEILEEYNHTRKNGVNYLLNVAPRGDGSIHPEDLTALKGFSKLIIE